MPRKPNYRFERSLREKNKALKKAERLKARAEKTAARRARADGTETEDETQGEPKAETQGETRDQTQGGTEGQTQDGGISGSG